MNEQQALAKMVPPGQRRSGKVGGFGVIQILVTSACNLSCFACTQASNLARKAWFMTADQFEQAVLSLQGYPGVVGVFGGCPTISPHFEAYCEILRKHVPKERCGLWANNLMGKGAACRATFSPAVSNLNVHLDRDAWDEMKRSWPESQPFGLTQDSRHSPPFVAMRDVLRKECDQCVRGRQKDQFGGFHVCKTCDGTGQVYDESLAWDLIAECKINQHWSALIGVFRGKLRAWFCEIAGAQAILHQDDPDYPDTGLDPAVRYEHETAPGDRHERTVGRWWQLGMAGFAGQARKHCHECGVPLRGYGELAVSDQSGTEQTTVTHQSIYKPKRMGRAVELVTIPAQLGIPLAKMTDYIGNATR
jgi:hypothetical protein